MHTPEWHEKREIKKYLDDRRVWYFCPFMAGRGKAGVPDIIVCWNGRFVAIEVKRPGKKPTPLQKRRMWEIERAGGFAVWGDAGHVIAELPRLL